MILHNNVSVTCVTQYVNGYLIYIYATLFTIKW